MKREKLLQKIKNHPKGVRPEELCRLLESGGYQRQERKVRGSHLYYYLKPGGRVAIHFPHPHPGKEVKPCYVRLVLKILEAEVQREGE